MLNSVQILNESIPYFCVPQSITTQNKHLKGCLMCAFSGGRGHGILPTQQRARGKMETKILIENTQIKVVSRCNNRERLTG